MYKWTDADGSIHYGERPPNRGQATNIAPPPPPGTGYNRPEDIKKIRDGIFQQTVDSVKAKEEAEKRIADDKASVAYCLRIKKKISTIKSNPRIKMTDKDGRASFLDESQKQQKIQKMKALLKEHCS